MRLIPVPQYNFMEAKLISIPSKQALDARAYTVTLVATMFIASIR